jgi:protein-L-isoaspartate O-methyltransferase
LPDQRYGRGLEVGCSIGVLTAALAPRCDDLLAIDLAPAAVERARARLAGLDQVRVEVGDIGEAVPSGPFDLIVLSEVGYYLTLAHLRDVLNRLEAELAPGGTLVACHWRHHVGDYPLTGDQVHRVLARDTRLTRVVAHEEADFLLDVYSADPRSVAARTGLL